MKSFARTFFIAAVLTAPALCMAQESGTTAVKSQQSNDAVASSYGGAVNSKDQAGSQQNRVRTGSNASTGNCAGPVSYCSIFFGN
ncbi:hypothetical protein J8I87_31590 [Paraburkholderia sp. LEh10]|nr:hypothetical protein [Paraburkholderia sp. LEh10]